MREFISFFQSTDHLSNLGFVIRTLVSLLLIYFMTRFLKKRAAGQFTSFDFVFLWMLGALAVAPLLDGKILFTTTMIAIATLYFWHFVISWIRTKNHTLSRFLTGRPTVLVKNGQINETKMKRSFFNNELLVSELRLAHCYDLAEADQIILETSGHLSVIKKSDYTPATPKDFQITVPPSRLPTVLINNGNVLFHNLKALSLSEKWLKDELSKQGVSNTEIVYLATINSSGNLYYSIKSSS